MRRIDINPHKMWEDIFFFCFSAILPSFFSHFLPLFFYFFSVIFLFFLERAFFFFYFSIIFQVFYYFSDIFRLLKKEEVQKDKRKREKEREYFIYIFSKYYIVFTYLSCSYMYEWKKSKLISIYWGWFTVWEKKEYICWRLNKTWRIPRL